MVASTDNWLFLRFHITIKTRHFFLISYLRTFLSHMIHPAYIYIFFQNPRVPPFAKYGRQTGERACDLIWPGFDRFPQSGVRDSSRCTSTSRWQCCRTTTSLGGTTPPPLQNVFAAALLSYIIDPIPDPSANGFLHGHETHAIFNKRVLWWVGAFEFSNIGASETYSVC